MTLITLLVSAVIFLLGVALGRRFHVASLSVLIALILGFAALDYAIVKITLWPLTYWVIVDLIAAQLGYLVGAFLKVLAAERQAGGGREPKEG